MKKLTCKQLMGDAGCDFVAEGETAEDVKSKMTAHAMEAHADYAKSMMEKDPEYKANMEKMMDEMITEE